MTSNASRAWGAVPRPARAYLGVVLSSDQMGHATAASETFEPVLEWSAGHDTTEVESGPTVSGSELTR